MPLNLTIVNQLNQPGMNSFQAYTAIAAFAALALAVINTYLRWRDKQPSLTVDVLEYVDSTHSLTHDLERVISIRGYNSGQIPLNITGYYLFLSSSHIAFSLGKPYTTRVLPGGHCERWEYADKISRHLNKAPYNLSGTVKMIGCLIDDGERWYKSKEFEFDIDRALRGTKGKQVWTSEEIGFKSPKGFLQKMQYRVKNWRKRKYLPPY